MSAPVKAVREDDSLSLADWEMAFAEIRHLLVVDRAGIVVGLISDRDVLRAIETRPGGSVRIGAIMTRDIITVTPGTPAVTAVEELLQHKVSALPVVDERGRPVGIVTSTDFLEIARRALDGIDPTVKHARA